MSTAASPGGPERAPLYRAIPYGWRMRFTIMRPVRLRGEKAGHPWAMPSMNTYQHHLARSGLVKRHREAARRAACAAADRWDSVAQSWDPPLTPLQEDGERGKRLVRLTLVRGKWERMLDDGNLGTALKPYVDGIKDAALLIDDSWEWCRVDHLQARDSTARRSDDDVRRGYRVEVEISPMRLEKVWWRLEKVR